MMAIVRPTITRLSQSLKANSRSFFSASTTSSCPISTPFLLYNYTSISQRHVLLRLRFPFPSGGPLFLSNPPWKLSQTATPLLLQSDAVLNFLKLRALSLLQRPALPYNVGFRSSYDAQKLLTHVGPERIGDTPEILAAGVTDSYFNLPNYISFTRLLSGPLLGWMITHDMHSYAFVGLAISGATDWLDGYMARKMGINSVVGSYLDPLADKVLIGCVALAMVDKGLLHPGVVSLVVLRDIALVGGAFYKRANSFNWEWKSWHDFFNLDGANAQKVEPLFISKLNTVFQLVLVAAALLQPELGNEDTQIYINYLSWLVVSTTVASTAAYGAQHLRIGSAFRKPGFRS